VTSIGGGTAPAARSSPVRAARTRAGVSAGASSRSTTATCSPAGSWTTWYWRTSSSSRNGARNWNGWTVTGPASSTAYSWLEMCSGLGEPIPASRVPGPRPQLARPRRQVPSQTASSSSSRESVTTRSKLSMSVALDSVGSSESGTSPPAASGPSRSRYQGEAATAWAISARSRSAWLEGVEVEVVVVMGCLPSGGPWFPGRALIRPVA
jgi:hypothetical protein